MTVTVVKQSKGAPEHCWWKEASIYQIYPASFKDSNGDGWGDIRGIIDKLDYLKDVGVDAVWLCPIFKSPQVDMGYDISDYRDIHPPYGTVRDVDDLIAGLHERGMKCVLDLVVNHTSDQHEWFKSSRSSLDSPHRDWYIWRKPRFTDAGERQPPNNWRAAFGGSAWTFDESTGEYYLHLFAPEQPDLNWENPAVVREVHDVMSFWLDKGADGFRMDVINLISKEPGLPDAPITRPGEPWQDALSLVCNGPRLHGHLRGLRALLDRYGAFSVGEMPGVKEEDQVAKVVAADRKELHTIFQFDIVDMDIGPGGKFSRQPWTLPVLKGIIAKWQLFALRVGGWNSVFMENHDQARSVSRFTHHRPEHRVAAAKLLATCLCSLGGTLFVYQGQELGMANLPRSWGIEEYKDIETQNLYKEAVEAIGDDEKALEELWTEIRLKARDHARSPVQWDTSPHAGFTTGTPWMRVNDNYGDINAAQQQDDPASVLQYWRSCLAARKDAKRSLVYGSFEMFDAEDTSIFACARADEGSGEKALVVLNFADEERSWAVPETQKEVLSRGRLVMSTHGDSEVKVNGQAVVLRPFEGVVIVEAGASK
ncbi:oligo-1,6-glucosidase [Plectosphaerella cucumerina]|uniref:Oligo-1,6-glucosidase n=1 Tax=Plectosphaerella cucumerina TaxID=40658 RepID=A0A8K0X9B6_9PEZI|nr:oligo-1,6-glucosidase [Plectosphaerella cucumerina]